MSWSRLIDLELGDDEKLDMVMPMPMDRPDYPCGLCICLTERELEKLDLDGDCEVGDVIDLRAFAAVTSVSKSEGPDGPKCRIELQIQKLAVENEMTEEDMPAEPTEKPKSSRREALYPKHGPNWDQDLIA